MPFILTVDVPADYVRYQIAGPASLKNYFDLIEEAARHTQVEGHQCLLVDMRGVTGRLHLSDQVFIGEMVVRKLSHLRKLATVVPDSPDTYHSEKVAKLHGFQLRGFSGEAEAVAWLLESGNGATHP
jgi:hypothetical protein